MKVVVLFIVLLNFVFADTLQIKKGWQLIGIPTTIDVEKSFNNPNVDIVWSFDGATQNWSGYSPNDEKEIKIVESYSLLTSLKSWQAIWIYSYDDWSLEYQIESSVNTPANSTIELFTGWNLISIPQKIVVSDSFFDGFVVWKYDTDQEWSVNDSSLNFPSIDNISLNQGLWVQSDKDIVIDIDKQSSKLNIFNSKESMLSYIEQMIKMNDYYFGGIYPEVAIDDALVPSDTNYVAEDTSSDVKNTTDTNLQEAGVDESDIVKNDGTYILSVDNDNANIVITSFSNIANKIYTPINTIDFPNKQVISIYLQNNRLSVLSNNVDSKFVEDTYIWYNYSNNFSLDIYDVSDIDNISLISTYNLDGSYKDSRLVDGNLFLISEFNPIVTYEYNKIYIDTICTTFDSDDIYANCSATSVSAPPCEEGKDCEDAEIPYEEKCEYGKDYLAWQENNCYAYNYDEKGAYKYDYENPIVLSEKLIPTITKNTTVSDLVEASKFYAPNKLNQRAAITTISSYKIDDGSYKESISFLGNTHTYYASLGSLYLVSSEYPLYYDFVNYQDQQMIYQFSIGDSLDYKGRGFVKGRMLSQFSMGEHNDYLRVATTSGWSWWGNATTTNDIYTLKNIDRELKVEGMLTGLGHEGETIKAVRFMQDRGFVVTFKQTDPLYTIDLSDPKNPKKVGELEIPGYSEYLHIVDDNRVLSIGRDANEEGVALALQLQLFDISDFTNPLLANKMQIGDKDSYSEAQYNHKAFTYRSSDLMFAVPYKDNSGYDYKGNEYLGIYQIDGMSINQLKIITSESSDWGNTGRGLLFDINETSYGALIKGSNIICETIEDEI